MSRPLHASPVFPYTTLFRSMKRLELKGVEFAEVTLHVGLGTFRPVEVEDLTKHKMDSEQFIIEQKQADIVKDRKSTRLNSSHRCISYAVFCLKKNINKTNGN